MVESNLKYENRIQWFAHAIVGIVVGIIAGLMGILEEFLIESVGFKLT